MAKRRPTRMTLRGWTRGLPPLAACFGLMFLFAWLESQRLDNEYRAQEVTEEILHVKSTIGKLREQQHHLNRMENMEQNAPELSLMEADPGQIVIVRGEARRAAPGVTDSRFAERRLAPPARSVVFRLGAPKGGKAVTVEEHEIARMESEQMPPG